MRNNIWGIDGECFSPYHKYFFILLFLFILNYVLYNIIYKPESLFPNFRFIKKFHLIQWKMVIRCQRCTHSLCKNLFRSSGLIFNSFNWKLKVEQTSFYEEKRLYFWKKHYVCMFFLSNFRHLCIPVFMSSIEKLKSTHLVVYEHQNYYKLEYTCEN